MDMNIRMKRLENYLILSLIMYLFCLIFFQKVSFMAKKSPRRQVYWVYGSWLKQKFSNFLASMFYFSSVIKIIINRTKLKLEPFFIIDWWFKVKFIEINQSIKKLFYQKKKIILKVSTHAQMATLVNTQLRNWRLKRL